MEKQKNKPLNPASPAVGGAGSIQHPGSRKAVTLIELIMVITIVGILTTAASMYIKETIGLWRFVSSRSEVTAQVRTALLRMGREIRQVKNSSSIAAADLSRLSFTALDLNGDTTDDTVEFFLNAGNELRRIFNSSPATGDILASGITGLTFTYYDINNALLSPLPLSDTSQIRRIAISVSVESAAQSKTLKLQVYPRNL